MKKDKWNGIIVLAGFISAMLILFGIGVVIPVSMSNGVEKLEGIARPEDMPFVLETYSWTGLDRFSSYRPGGTYSWTIIEEVDYTPVGRCTKRDSVDAYTITSKRVGLFGIKTKEMVRYPPKRCLQRLPSNPNASPNKTIK